MAAISPHWDAARSDAVALEWFSPCGAGFPGCSGLEEGHAAHPAWPHGGRGHQGATGPCCSPRTSPQGCCSRARSGAQRCFPADRAVSPTALLSFPLGATPLTILSSLETSICSQRPPPLERSEAGS